MKQRRVLITADPINRLKPHSDTSLAIAAEYLKRRAVVDWCDLTEQSLQKNSRDFLEKLTTRRLLSFDPQKNPFVDIEKSKTSSAFEYDIILHRKDPPVNDWFLNIHRAFLDLPSSILQINHPSGIYKFSEHGLPLLFPELSVPTFLCKTFEDLEKTLKNLGTEEAVLKSMVDGAGLGIRFIETKMPTEQVRKIFDELHPLIVQPFLENIGEIGDLRVLVANQKVVGQILRMPAAGSRLANLARGGTAHFQELSVKQTQSTHIVARKLAEEGLHFLGLDFLGDLLSEVNFTSPTGIVSASELMKKDTAKESVDEFELMLSERI